MRGKISDVSFRSHRFPHQSTINLLYSTMSGRRDRQRQVVQDALANRRAEEALEREVTLRILSPAISSTTASWNIPDGHDLEPPSVPDFVGNEEYGFQDALPSRRKNWAWITQNTTLFYQSNQDFYYLRMKSSNCGISDQDWKSLFPQARRVPSTFRTFELIDVTELNRLEVQPERRLPHVVYFEVDLASRAPQHHIAMDFNEDDDMADEVPALLEQVDQRMEVLPAPLRAAPSPISTFAFFVASILFNQFPTDLLLAEFDQINVVMTFETRSSIDGEVIMLQRSVNLDLMPYRANDDLLDLMRDFALKILQLIWKIRTAIMVDHYEENGTFTFHPRSVRFILQQPDIAANGMLFTAPPPDLRMPRGGCLSVTGMPIGLVKMVTGKVISHDLHRPGMYFDNNCGIREAMIAGGLVPKSFDEMLNLYCLAATWRAETPNLQPFIKLTPQEVFDVVAPRVDGAFIFSIYRLPTPKHPEGEKWEYCSDILVPIDSNTHKFYLIYSHGHYFGFANEETKDRDYNWVQQIRYCTRCLKYYHPEMGNRVSHFGEASSAQYPECKLKGSRKGGFIVRKPATSPDEGQPLSLSSCSPTPEHMMTPVERIGFMDLETWRPPTKNNYHEVYAVGWIQTASQTIETKDVKIYNSLDDPLVENAALVHAFVDLIAYILSKPEVFTKKAPYYLYLYNGSGFDNLFILNTLAVRFKMSPSDMSLKEGRLMTMSYLDGVLVVRDLVLFTLCSLDKACKIYKVEDHLAKGKLDHDALKSVQDIENMWGTIEEYLRKDLTALNMVFLAFQATCYRVFKLDVCPRITMSHLSYDYWKTCLSETHRRRVILPRTFDEYHTILRAYYGGRVFPQIKEWTSPDYGKPYDQIEKYLVLTDVVSLYPSVMWRSPNISKRFFKSRWMESARNSPKFFTGEPKHLTHGKMFDAIEKLLLEGYDPKWNPGLEPKDFWIERSLFHKSCFKMDTHGAFVQIDWHIDPEHIPGFPILPHKDAKGNTAWDFRPQKAQWYVIDEVLDAIFYGYRVTRVYQAYFYPQRVALFDNCMEVLMKGKAACKKDDPEREIYKLGANSIYGKHAQKALVEESKLILPSELMQFMKDHDVISVEPICDATMIETKHLRKPKTCFNLNEEETDEFIIQMQDDLDAIEDQDQNFAIKAFLVKFKPKVIKLSKPTHLGAQVTAFARMHMNWLAYKMDLMRNSDDITQKMIYTDTDSLFIHVEATKRCPEIFGSDLGMLDDELTGGKIIDCVFLAPKTYCLEYVMPDNHTYLKVRCKGFPHPKGAIDVTESSGIIDPVAPKFRRCFNISGETGLPILVPENIPMQMQIYSLEMANEHPLYIEHLSPPVFRVVLHSKTKDQDRLAVYFTSMRKNYCGKNTIGDISGICHSFTSRSLKMASWWKDETGAEKHRFPHPDNPEHMVPIGFPLNVTPLTPDEIVQAMQVEEDWHLGFGEEVMED